MRAATLAILLLFAATVSCVAAARRPPPPPKLPFTGQPVGFPGPTSIQSGFYKFRLTPDYSAACGSKRTWYLSYSNSACGDPQTNPVLRPAQSEERFRAWTLSWVRHVWNSYTDEVYLFNYNYGNGPVNCSNGFLAPANPTSCLSKTLVIRPPGNPNVHVPSQNYYPWRATPVPGLNNTYTFTTSGREGVCRRYLGALGGCNEGPATLGLVADESSASRWYIQPYGLSEGQPITWPHGTISRGLVPLSGGASGATFVVQGADGKETLVTLP